MALTDVDKLVGVGIVPEQAKRIVEVAQGGSTAVAWDDITGKPVNFPTEWDIIDGVPSEFPPETPIALADLATGALPAAITVASANIVDGTITNGDINASAAIALSKLANVAAGTDGLAAGTIQATLQALATRIQALEDAAP